MINYFELRASDMAASGDDPYAAVNAELFIGPMVRIFSFSSQCSTEISLFYTCFLQLIGVILNILLYGMQLLQVEIYFRSNPRFVFPFHTLFHHHLCMILTRIVEHLCYSNCKRYSRTQRLEVDQGAGGILAPVGYCQFRLRRVVRV